MGAANGDCFPPGYNVVMRGVIRTWASILSVGVLGLSLAAWSEQSQKAAAKSETQDQSEERSQRAAELSSSKDTRIDLSAPKDDAQRHPQSDPAVIDNSDQGSDVQEFRPWDPHKAAKDIEIGDFYYRRKNYPAALARYQEALTYKPNDALANFRLAECQEKTGNLTDAVIHYQQYLKLLPHGALAEEAERAIGQLKAMSARQRSQN
ncbi:MAG: tetratricopeptide repeat protein [Acidobacteria bacterium]|nr:tetratricopeptide repeat protein [Acidobacteriota bacterium]